MRFIGFTFLFYKGQQTAGDIQKGAGRYRSIGFVKAKRHQESVWPNFYTAEWLRGRRLLAKEYVRICLYTPVLGNKFQFSASPYA